MKAEHLFFLSVLVSNVFAGPIQNGGFDDFPQTPALIANWANHSGSRLTLANCSTANGTLVTCTSTTGLVAGMRITGSGLVTSPANASLIVTLPITPTSFTVTGGSITTCPSALSASYTLPAPVLSVSRSNSAQAGSFSLRVDGRDAPLDGVKQTITLTNGARYTVRFYIKVDAHAQVRCMASIPGTSQLVLLAETIIDEAHAGTWVLVEGTTPPGWSGSQPSAVILLDVEQIYTQGAAAPAGAFPGYNLDSISMELDTDGDGYSDIEEVPADKNTNPLLADSDGDGLPDKWEITHLLNANDNTDALLDPDGDGHASFIEYWANTDPQSPASYPGLTSDPLATPATKALLYFLQTRGARGLGRYLTGHHAQDIAGGDYTTYVAGLNTLMAAASHPSWVSILSVAAEGPSAAQPLQIIASAPLLREYIDAGGIGLLHWTPRNPVTNGSNGDKTHVDLATLMTPGTASNLLMTGWMDAIAAELAALGPDRPVIFRPFSEQNGNWNWYGRIPRNDFLTLYRWVRDCFVAKGLHNIIWTIEHHIGVHRPGGINSGNFGVSMDYYYPGDEAIDLIGFSNYISGWNPGFDANAQSRLHPKAFAITEGGPPANEDDVPNNYNSLYLNALDTWFPRSAFFVIWNSWNTGPFVAIKDNANYVPLLTDTRVTNRESLNYLNTTAYWQAAHGLLNQPLDSDADQDGLVNVLEAALGSNALVSSSNTLSQGLVTLGGQSYATITYTRDPGILDLVTTVEWSSDLQTWSSTAVREVSRTTQYGLEVITVRSNTPVSSRAQFLRVRVTMP